MVYNITRIEGYSGAGARRKVANGVNATRNYQLNNSCCTIAGGNT